MKASGNIPLNQSRGDSHSERGMKPIYFALTLIVLFFAPIIWWAMGIPE